MYQRQDHGWIEVITGSMFSGKTEELIRRARRAQIARQKVQVFNHLWDTRYGDGEEIVASHSGWNLAAKAVSDVREILGLTEEDTQVVVIDEGHFFSSAIVDVCETLANGGRRVIIALLNQDFRGEPFGPAPLLMASADEVTTLNAICIACGAPASRTQRIIDGNPAPYDAPVIMVGADEAYEARCRHCHQVPREGEES